MGTVSCRSNCLNSPQDPAQDSAISYMQSQLLLALLLSRFQNIVCVPLLPLGCMKTGLSDEFRIQLQPEPPTP